MARPVPSRIRCAVDAEVARLDELLADDGVVHLWFEAPPGADAAELGERAAATLVAGGLRAERRLVDGLAHVVGRRAG